jgi:hypothetical protein
MMYQAGMRAKQGEVKVYPFPERMAVAFNADFSGFADPQIRTCGIPNDQQNNACPLEFGGRAYAAATPRPARRPTPFSVHGRDAAASRDRTDLVRRIWRQWHRHLRSINQRHQGTNAADVMERALRRCAYEARGGLDWLDANNHVARLDTQTNEIVEYLLSRSTNIRRVFVDDTGARLVLWFGSNHSASM